MKDALDIHRELLGREIPHEIIRAPRPLSCSDDIPEVTGLRPEQCAVVRFFLVNESRLVAVVIPAGEQPWPGAVLDAVGGVTVETASDTVVNRVTDYAAALSAPLLLPRDVPVLLDERLARQEVLYTATGGSGTLLGLSTAHLLTLTGAEIHDLRAPATITGVRVSPQLVVTP